MAGSSLLQCLLWTVVFAVTKGQTPDFMIAAPRMLHVGIAETVWVQLQWPQGSKPPSGNVNADVVLRNQITMKDCSKKETIQLNSGNDYTASKSLQLTPQLIQFCELDQMRSSRYVQLAVVSKVFGSKPKVVNIPVSYKRGYIFIQTDKSIYTPKETVHIRIYTLDHMMRPTEEKITFTVSNAQDLQVRKGEQFSLNSVVKESLLIPDISTPGVWKVSAYFKTAPESNTTVEFEVKKYVLPNFEVKIIPKVPYFLISMDTFTVNVKARYVYGEDVVGVAYVRVGITGKDGQRTILSGLEQQIKLTDGDAAITIIKEDILERIKQPEDALLEFNLYVAASVIETASGVLEEKELTSVKFVASPYQLDLSKTKRYFIPGSPTQIVAEVSHVDGSPATGIFVTLSQSNVEKHKFKSDDKGVVTFILNTNQQDKTLDITIKAGEDSSSMTENIRLYSYNSRTNGFLHMSTPNEVLSIGQTIQITLKLVAPNPGRVKKLYYMVLNKGQTLSLKSIVISDLMRIQIPVTTSMIPSVRVIAYYYLGSEIVANSVWVDVTDVCEGKLLIRNGDGGKDISPRGGFELVVETDGTSTVSLAAVDTAVYALNSKNKLTPDKMFRAMNAYDLGCSPGGGKDYRNVFMDAGLAFVSSAGYSDINEFGCRVQERQKRSPKAQDPTALAKQKVHSYSAELQSCCRDGMVLLPRRMNQDCNKRAGRVPSKPCRDAFLECCIYAGKLRKDNRRKTSGVGRTQGMEEEVEFTDEDDVQLRSYFPESWLWRTINVNREFREKIYVPDSITTWEIQGVGMSQGKGFCIADPIKVRVFKNFHIYMRVPYSIKRFEQIELRPVLYNYNTNDIKVKVYMEETEGICSPRLPEPASDGQIVTVPASSALTIPFAVVPIGKTNVPVKVIALGENGFSDGVEKTLRIEREGVSVLEEKTYIMNPRDSARSSITIDDELPTNMIPDGEFRSSIRVSMDVTNAMINKSLSADGISRLIRVPRGCAEQTMILTAPGLYALRYLDQTGKWAMLPPDRKDEGQELMLQGYTRILQFRKSDGSYGAWIGRTSSTWLTAFVAKVMSLSRKYVDVDVNEIRLSTDYLCSMQTSTGAFQEKMPVIHQDMQGGVSGTDAEVSLAAYVTVALHHSLDALSDNTKVKSAIQKAVEYLRVKLDSLSEPYPLAITAYALTLASADPVLKDKAYTLLISKQQGDPKKSEMFFGPRGSALAVETSSYALLTALLRKDLSSANLIYTWLTEQQNYGGGFKSTQDTVMALEALSEYLILSNKEERNSIEVEINSLERQQKQKFFLRNEDSVQEELRSMGTKFGIKVSGKGKATVTVLKMYNIMQIENATCSKLGLEVTLLEVDGKLESIDEDYEDYDYEDVQSDEPIDAIGWHDLRKRARREVSRPKAEEPKVSYQVCVWKKPGAQIAGMAIVDITLLSGFEPNTQDLDKLKTNSERYISHYELQNGRLLMYFDKIPDTKDECVAFEAIQTIRVSLLQPASAVVYDFYEPDKRCTTFYGAPQKPKFINTLCAGDVCQCAEGACPEKRSVTHKGRPEMSSKDREMFACYNPIVMYGYKLKVEDIQEQDAFLVYQTRILEALQKNGDEDLKAGDVRFFYQRKSCKMRLGKLEYLIMGQDGETKDAEGRMRYFLESSSWVEGLPAPRTCAATRFRNACAELNTFMENYRANGCQV
ncbi:complement C4-like [Spea bombifrons]|uniref:complement C4-like n=1 Tax=Spea bombifrons TaxID=233779 RepID=UPI00234A6A4B|nr:complement C4-like [Spea bombifrons]